MTTRAPKVTLDLADVQAFLAVVQERGFSRAAVRLHRTQPTVSLAVRRLEKRLGQQLFDRTSNPGVLTEAGYVLKDYAERLIRLAEEAESSVCELEDLRRGRVLIGTNDAGVYSLLPLIQRFQTVYPGILVDLQRIHSRLIPSEIVQGNLDFGLMNFQSREVRLRTVSLGVDELVAIVPPKHPLAKRQKLTISEWARESIIFHNDPSPARERAVRLAEERQTPLNVRIGLPTLDGIKLAVKMGLGVSLLPRSCAADEIKRGHLAAVPIPEMRLPREVRLVYHRTRRLSHAATAFLKVASEFQTRVKSGPPRLASASSSSAHGRNRASDHAGPRAVVPGAS